MTPIQISDHPEIAGVKRKATRHSLLVDDAAQEVILTILVTHYKEVEIPGETEEDEPTTELVKLQTMPDVQAILRVDNQTMVDEEGNIVPSDSEDAVYTEWYFFSQILANLPVQINAFIQQKINWADNLPENKINKFYY